MRDMNIAKLTSADVPLFSAIMQDLFPSVELPVIDYGKVFAPQGCPRPRMQRWIRGQDAWLLGLVLPLDELSVRAVRSLAVALSRTAGLPTPDSAAHVLPPSDPLTSLSPLTAGLSTFSGPIHSSPHSEGFEETLGAADM